MSEMIDRVAEAIWQAEWTRAGNRGNRRVPWSDNSEEHMDRYRFLARAAIEAMMEPTEAMIDAARAANYSAVAKGAAGLSHKGLFKAMLSEALSPSLKEQEEGN